MPVNNSLMDSLRKKYGRKGTNVYYAMENSGKKSFRKGLKTAGAEGHTSSNLAAYKRKRKKGRKS